MSNVYGDGYGYEVHCGRGGIPNLWGRGGGSGGGSDTSDKAHYPPFSSSLISSGLRIFFFFFLPILFSSDRASLPTQIFIDVTHVRLQLTGQNPFLQRGPSLTRLDSLAPVFPFPLLSTLKHSKITMHMEFKHISLPAVLHFHHHTRPLIIRRATAGARAAALDETNHTES